MKGFLGTDATLTADLSLVMGVGVALLLTVGVMMARRKQFETHRKIQSAAVALNVLQVGVVMVGSFFRSVAPGVPSQLGDSYYAIAVGHGLLGMVTLVFGVFVALRANELVPGWLRFHNFKLFMRTAYGLYMSATLAGVAVYLTWYTDLFTPAPEPALAPEPVALAAPTLAPTVAPTLPPVIVAALPTVAPTLPPTAVPTPKPQPRGALAWHDETVANDALVLSVENLAGEGYRAWLRGPSGDLPLGALQTGRAQTLAFSSPDGTNLIANYDQIVIGSSVDNPVLSGALPKQALAPLRETLAEAAGLRKETNELLRHAEFLKEALDDGNLPLEKLHAEHIVNLIEGSHGEHYGDLNGNGRVENPGDGFGLLLNEPQDGYIKGMRDHALLAAASPDATQDIKLHAGHVEIAGANTLERVTDIRDRALDLFKARSVADTRSGVARILALAHQTIQGVDLNGDEQIAPIPGEGGVVVAYQHAQLMAAIAVSPETARVAASAPTLVPTRAPTAAPTLVPTPVLPTPTAIVRSVAQTLGVSIRDNSFAPQSLTVPVGSTVVWTHNGQRPHTVTADDEAFGTDVLKGGATFQQTFSAIGTFLYYCELHGAPGGSGMAATIQVVPA